MSPTCRSQVVCAPRLLIPSDAHAACASCQDDDPLPARLQPPARQALRTLAPQIPAAAHGDARLLAVLGARNSVARMARFGVPSGSLAFARLSGKPRKQII